MLRRRPLCSGRSRFCSSCVSPLRLLPFLRRHRRCRESPPVPRFPRLSPPLRRPSLYPHPLCAFSFPPLLHRCRLRRLRRCLCPCLRPPRLACLRPVSPRPRHRLGRCLPVHRVPCCWWHRRWLPLSPFPPCPSRCLVLMDPLPLPRHRHRHHPPVATALVSVCYCIRSSCTSCLLYTSPSPRDS